LLVLSSGGKSDSLSQPPPPHASLPSAQFSF
jgi:hypothetical protein